MTPRDFIEKWRDASAEHAVAQPHLVDLCRLLGESDPQTADPAREWFCFERGAKKAGGGAGWADVWRLGCLGWEYKSRGRNLDEAYHGLFKCNLRRIADYPALSAYQTRILAIPGIRETVNIDHIKRGYYSIKALNPTGIVPMGPALPAALTG